MPHNQRELSGYRMERANEDLVTAKLNCSGGMYKAEQFLERVQAFLTRKGENESASFGKTVA